MTSPEEHVRLPAGRLLGALFASVFLGLFLGFFLYRNWILERRNAPTETADAPANETRRPFQQETPAPNANPGSSLDLIRSDGFGRTARENPKESQAKNLTQAIRGSESRYEKLAILYTQKYPVIREYGRDWAGYPDLRQFNLDYNRDHDPIKFAFNVASSRNFPALVQKYGNRPEIIGFIQDAIKTAPGELLQASRDYLSQDNHAKDLLKRFISAAGLPDSLAGALTNGAATPGTVSSAIQSNPKLKELLNQQSIDPNRFNQNLAPKQ